MCTLWGHCIPTGYDACEVLVLDVCVQVSDVGAVVCTSLPATCGLIINYQIIPLIQISTITTNPLHVFFCLCSILWHILVQIQALDLKAALCWYWLISSYYIDICLLGKISPCFSNLLPSTYPFFVIVTMKTCTSSAYYVSFLDTHQYLFVKNFCRHCRLLLCTSYCCKCCIVLHIALSYIAALYMAVLCVSCWSISQYCCVTRIAVNNCIIGH